MSLPMPRRFASPASRRLSVAAVLLVLSVLGVGCATLKQLLAEAFQQPTLNFKELKVTNVSLSGATLNLLYELDNPNALGVSLAEVDYALFVEDKQVVAGRPPKGLQLPAQRKTEIAFPAEVKFQDV